MGDVYLTIGQAGPEVVDPSPLFIAKARELAADLTQVTFEVGDAVSLPLKDSSFDVVVFHTTLCHVPGPERALAEALRVLRPGTLAVFDGDYSTTTVALSDGDPVQACVRAVLDGLVYDRWLVRATAEAGAGGGFRGHAAARAQLMAATLRAGQPSGSFEW